MSVITLASQNSCPCLGIFSIIFKHSLHGCRPAPADSCEQIRGMARIESMLGLQMALLFYGRYPFVSVSGFNSCVPQSMDRHRGRHLSKILVIVLVLKLHCHGICSKNGHGCFPSTLERVGMQSDISRCHKDSTAVQIIS